VTRVALEDIVKAYEHRRSVWKAAKDLGICGQSVHERLVAAGIPMQNPRWSEEEVNELKELMDHIPLGEISRRLGRTFSATACKANELGLGRTGRKREVKLPRAQGYDKPNIRRLLKKFESSDKTITQFVRANGLNIEAFMHAVERTDPGWRDAHWKVVSGLDVRKCTYCSREFYPANKRQVFCTRKCGSRSKVDATYFGGRMMQAPGMSEGICQLCEKPTSIGLTAHHMIGKENDPDNEYLIALCRGCHQIITIVGGRTWATDSDFLSQMIALIVMRKLGAEAISSDIEIDVDVQIRNNTEDGVTEYE